MRVTLVDNDGTVIETVQLMQVEGKDRVQVIRAFEAFAQEYAELDENDEMKFVVS
jgi:negative regulator of sigma E activity